MGKVWAERCNRDVGKRSRSYIGMDRLRVFRSRISACRLIMLQFLLLAQPPCLSLLLELPYNMDGACVLVGVTDGVTVLAVAAEGTGVLVSVASGHVVGFPAVVASGTGWQTA